jgi:outer membrane receptor protein involved in Fe transport
MRGSVVPRTVGVTRDLELDQQAVPGTTRLADPWTVDVRVEWPLPVTEGEVGLILEVRNLFDRQAPLAGDPRWSVSDRPDLEGGRPAWGEPLLRQSPRTVWAGARWSWR